MKKVYNTKPIDYTGCDPVVTEHLKRCKSVYCDCGHGIKDDIVGYIVDDGSEGIYVGMEYHYTKVIPIQKTPYLKKSSEIVSILEREGYTVEEYGFSHGEKRNFTFETFFGCGKEIRVSTEYYEKEWIEYK